MTNGSDLVKKYFIGRVIVSRISPKGSFASIFKKIWSNTQELGDKNSKIRNKSSQKQKFSGAPGATDIIRWPLIFTMI